DHSASLMNIDEIRDIRKVPFYNDEPKIYQYVAELHGSSPGSGRIVGHGSDLIRELAIVKAASEATERACLEGDETTPVTRLPVANHAEHFTNPHTFQSFTTHQLNSTAFSRMELSDDAEISWTAGINALTGKEVWIPAQLVFCPYDVSAEPILRFPSSNGAACASSVTEARCRAVLEVLERDAFMCWYLAAMPTELLDLEDLKLYEDLETIRIIYERYRLELKILLLPTSWPFHAVLAIIIDSAGSGPGLTVGMKCHPHLVPAIKGAIFEAQQMRPWIRDHIQLWGLPTVRKSDVRDYWSRAL